MSFGMRKHRRHHCADPRNQHSTSREINPRTGLPTRAQAKPIAHRFISRHATIALPTINQLHTTIAGLAHTECWHYTSLGREMIQFIGIHQALSARLRRFTVGSDHRQNPWPGQQSLGRYISTRRLHRDPWNPIAWRQTGPARLIFNQHQTRHAVWPRFVTHLPPAMPLRISPIRRQNLTRLTPRQMFVEQ